MASGEDLLKLFKAFKENDKVGFTKVAYDIIEEEKRKNHSLLANKLESMLFKNDKAYTFKSSKTTYLSNQIPVDKESGFDLMEMKFPKKCLQDIILLENNQKKINIILNEFKKKDILKSYGQYPKTRILFCGPPGTGKTITAEAISNELGIPMLYTRFDSIISSFLGETATNLRKIFEFSNEGEWVLFFDEFDSIAKSRDISSEHGELKRVVNSFLQLIDNFPKDKIIIAATNYEKLIDKALWRRFDEIIFFDKPEIEDIMKLISKILKRYKKKNFTLDNNAKKMIGMSFSDIERLCNNAIKEMILSNKDYIDDDIFLKCINIEKERELLVKNFTKE